MSRKSRGRTTGPKRNHVKTQADLTDWLNRAFSRGGRGRSHTAQKDRKYQHFGGYVTGHRGRHAADRPWRGFF